MQHLQFESYNPFMKQDQIVSYALLSNSAPTGSPYNNLYQYLCQFVSKLPQQHTKLNTIQHFERISEYLKKNTYHPKAYKCPSQIQMQSTFKIIYPQWITKQQKILLNSQKTSNKDVLIYNFDKTQQLLKQVGIFFGEEIGSKINTVLNNLANTSGVTTIRYWGKIITTLGNDYHIIQGSVKKKNIIQVTGDMQQLGQGVNYYTFWYSNDLMNKNWIQLPLITPKQLQQSKKIRFMFTGIPNLDLSKKTYPYFEGQQRHLLKAQLVRITHNCQIAPKGLFSTNQQKPDDLQFSEEFKYPQFAQLSNPQNWVHINPYILHLGRATYFEDPKLSQQQKQQLKAKWTQMDPLVQRLKPINEDKPPQKIGCQASWAIKSQGDLQIFNGKEQGNTNCYGTISLKNVNWPGWVTVSNMKNFTSIYIGYGYKSTQAPFSPLAPQDLSIQAEDNNQVDEPNPRQPPDELEPDSDEQNKPPVD